jgi:methyl-accepting chemotaxis protein
VSTAIPSHGFSIAEAERRIDRFFVFLLWAHFGASLLVAFWYSTFAAAFTIGLPAALVPTLFVKLQPGTRVTRCVIAAALMVYSALYIQQTHALIEAHFHVFSALAFLLAYRDWRPVITASVVVALHHVTFAILQFTGQPLYVYTSEAIGPVVLTLIHAGFVVFEASILIVLGVGMRREWERTEDLGRFQDALASGKLTGDDLTARLDWDPKSSLSDTANAIDGLLERLRSRIAAVKESAELILSNATQAAKTTEDVKAGGDFVRNSIQEVARGAEEQARQAADAAAQTTRTTDLLQQLASGAREQALLADEMADAVAALSQQTMQVSKASEKQASAAQMAREAAARAVQAVTTVAETADGAGAAADTAMQEAAKEREALTGAVDSLAAQVDELGKFSSGIRNFAQSISEIAEQTNLLALNAAIEAARAGEHGRGFAVVADEVRKLADQAGQAAKETQEMVSGMTTGIAHVLMATGGGRDSGKDTANEGLRARTAKGMSRIEEVLVRVRDEFAEVSDRAHDVIQAGQETAQLAESISQLAEQNRKATAEMGEAGANLSERISALRAQISSHDEAASKVASRSTSTQQAIEEIAAITEETSAATQQVASTVEEQFAGLDQLAGSAEQVYQSAQNVRSALDQFRTDGISQFDDEPAYELPKAA